MRFWLKMCKRKGLNELIEALFYRQSCTGSFNLQLVFVLKEPSWSWNVCSTLDPLVLSDIQNGSLMLFKKQSFIWYILFYWFNREKFMIITEAHCARVRARSTTDSYMFKVNNRNSIARYEMHSKLTIKTQILYC